MQVETELKRNLTESLIVAGDAEQRLIGALLIHPESINLDETRRFLNPDQFAVEVWRASYEAILELSAASKNFQPEYLAPIVAEACGMSLDDVVGCYIVAMGQAGSVTTAPEYARTVVRQWQHCQLRQMAIDLVHRLGQPSIAIEDSVAELARESERIREGYIETDDDETTLAGVLERFMDQPDAEVLPTGIQSLDLGLRDGVRRGQFVVIGARPSVGKSALCGQMAIGIAERHKKVMYLSFEMSTNEMVARWLNQTGMVLSDETDREVFGQFPIRAIASSGWTIDRIEAEARVAHRRGELDVLVVDYLGLIRPSDSRVNRVEQVSDMTRRLKVLAMSLDIPVIAAHQFNRAKEGRETQRPKMSDFRDSGSIEQDADILIGLHRDLTPGEQSNAWLYVMKQRSGETSDLEFSFDGPRTKFVEKVPDSPSFT